MLFKFLDSLFCFSSLDSFGSIDLLLNFGSNESNGFIIIHEFHAFFHLLLFFLVIPSLVSFQNFFNSIQSKIYFISTFIQRLQTVHYLEQVLNILVNSLMTSINILFGGCQEGGYFIQLLVYKIGHKRSFEIVCYFGISFSWETRNIIGTSNRQIFALFYEIDSYFTATLFWSLILHQVRSIFMINNFWCDVHPIH